MTLISNEELQQMSVEELTELLLYNLCSDCSNEQKKKVSISLSLLSRKELINKCESLQPLYKADVIRYTAAEYAELEKKRAMNKPERINLDTFHGTVPLVRELHSTPASIAKAKLIGKEGIKFVEELNDDTIAVCSDKRIKMKGVTVIWIKSDC